MRVSLCVVGCGEQAGKILDEARPVVDDLDLYFASQHVDDARSYNDIYGGVGVLETHEDAARDPRVDAMYFATPHHLHLEQALYAAEQGKHILMEKPIALTMAESQTMIAAARDAGVVLMVSEPVRYLPTVDKSKELIAHGAIGDIRLVHVQNHHYSRPGGWRTDAALRGGGELIDGGIHSVDIMVNLGGLPERVYAVLTGKVFDEVDGDEGSVVTAHLPGGAVGLLNQSAGTATKESDMWVMVTGSKGQIRFEPDATEVTADTAEGVRTIGVGSDSSVQLMMREFVASASKGSQPVMTGEEGTKDLAVVLAAYNSAELGEEVAVPFVAP